MKEQGMRFKLNQIQESRDVTYRNNAAEQRYPVLRGFDFYAEVLPKYKDNDLISIVLDTVVKNESNVRVLDIGCGAGLALGEIMREHHEVEGFGLSSYDYRRASYEAITKNVDYRVGDAHKLASFYPDSEFDIVMSLYTMEYLGDPLHVLKQAYKMTKPGGILLLDKIGAKMTTKEAETLKAVWEKSGLSFELPRWLPDSEERLGPSNYSLAIVRGETSRLILPFHYSGLRNDKSDFELKGEVYNSPTHVNYTFDHDLAAQLLK